MKVGENIEKALVKVEFMVLGMVCAEMVGREAGDGGYLYGS